MTVQDGTTWEFEEGMKLPHYVQIACEFTYIGKPEAFTNGYLFDLGWVREGKPQDFEGVNLEEHFSEYNKNQRKSNRTANRLRRRADRAMRRGDRNKSDELYTQRRAVLGEASRQRFLKAQGFGNVK
jgi:hypothetical protein